MFELREQGGRGGFHIQPLQRSGQRIADHVHESGHGRPEALDGIRQEPAGISSRVGTREPDRLPLGQLDGLLERHGLPVAGSGDQQDRARIEPVRDPSRQGRPGDPPGCQERHAVILTPLIARVKDPFNAPF